MKKIHNNVLFGVSLCAIALLGGCGDSGNVASLQARIDALEKKQKEDGAKLAAMGEKIVTKAIEVKGSMRANVVEVGEAESHQRIKIDGASGIRIDAINEKRKNGTVALLNAEELIIQDYQAFSKTKFGTGDLVSIGISDVDINGVRTGNTRVVMRRSDESSGGTVRKSLIEAVAVSAEVYWSGVGERNSAFSFISSGALVFAARLESISAEGILRFQLANVSSLTVGEVRGVIEYDVVIDKSRSKTVTKTAQFVIDRKMNSGKWESTAVSLEAKKDDIDGLITLRGIQVGDYFFNK